MSNSSFGNDALGNDVPSIDDSALPASGEIPVPPSPISTSWTPVIITVLLNVVAVLVILKIVPAEQADQWKAAIPQTVGAIAIVVGNVIGLVRYFTNQTNQSNDEMRRLLLKVSQRQGWAQQAGDSSRDYRHAEMIRAFTNLKNG